MLLLRRSAVMSGCDESWGMAAVRGSGWVALERRLEVASQVTGEREDIAAEVHSEQ